MAMASVPRARSGNTQSEKFEGERSDKKIVMDQRPSSSCSAMELDRSSDLTGQDTEPHQQIHLWRNNLLTSSLYDVRSRAAICRNLTNISFITVDRILH